jgi:16S rRNA (cytidine1402-2'-O)-methyltransferase
MAIEGKLYIVATPIGNLADLTLRAIEVLKEVDLIACEDTRRTKILLDYFKIVKPLISYHQHSRLQKIDYLVAELNDGKKIALVTDAGTPGISDPGGVLIRETLAAKIKVEPIPGPSSITALLSVSGANADKFLFLGYLPKKKGRQTLIYKFGNFEYPIVVFESPERIIRTLEELEKKWGNREVVIGRELTKKFEEILRGKISDVRSKIRPQGEFTIIIQPSKTGR